MDKMDPWDWIDALWMRRQIDRETYEALCEHRRDGRLLRLLEMNHEEWMKISNLNESE